MLGSGGSSGGVSAAALAAAAAASRALPPIAESATPAPAPAPAAASGVAVSSSFGTAIGNGYEDGDGEMDFFSPHLDDLPDPNLIPSPDDIVRASTGARPGASAGQRPPLVPSFGAAAAAPGGVFSSAASAGAETDVYATPRGGGDPYQFDFDDDNDPLNDIHKL
jgi:hypothetical protein